MHIIKIKKLNKNMQTLSVCAGMCVPREREREREYIKEVKSISQ